MNMEVLMLLVLSKTYEEANKYLKKMMNLREEAEREWLWYDIKRITFTP